MLYTYNLYHNFGRSPTIEKFNPQANFPQFQHWRYQHMSTQPSHPFQCRRNKQQPTKAGT